MLTDMTRPRLILHRLPALLTALTMVATQLALPPLAQASYPGSSTASAGSAPPPGATAVQSFQPDLFTGRATQAMGLAVPPGRKGMQPALALSYASSNRNSWVGMGWMLDLGAIERSTKNGIPTYGAADVHALMFQGISAELVKLPDGTYRAKDEGLFLRVEQTSGGWEVRDKSGTRYFFGSIPSANSQIANGSQVFRWALDKVLDIHGNTLTLTYTKDGNQLYPSRIDYTAHETSGVQDLAPSNYVEFTLEDRPDVEVSHRATFAITTAKRLKEIRTFAQTQLAKKYVLGYTLSQRTNRSLLTTLTTIGSDGTTGLPPVTFSYQDATTPTYPSVVSNNPAVSKAAWQVRVANLDTGHDNFGCVHPYSGLPWNAPVEVSGGFVIGGISGTVGSDGSMVMNGSQDYFGHAYTFLYHGGANPLTISTPFTAANDVEACLWREDAGGVTAIPGGAGSTTTLQPGWSILHITAYHQHQDWSDLKLSSPLMSLVALMSPEQFIAPQLAGDVNGNGITDLITFDPNTGNWKVSCATTCNLGLGGTWLTNFGKATLADPTPLPLVGDFDGDGKTDIATFTKGAWNFAKSLSSSFQAYYWGPVTFGTATTTPILGDFNGDGRTDIGTYENGTWAINFGTGGDFDTTADLTFSFGSSSHKPLTGDFNGDGLTDVAIVSNGTVDVRLSQGNGFAAATTWISGFVSSADHTSADLNGDGLTDLIAYDKPTGQVRWARSESTKFVDAGSLPMTFTLTGQDDTLQVADFNGDGIADPAVLNAFTGKSEIAISQGTIPDVLTGINNGLGGMTSIAYQPSTTTINTLLPFVIPVVQSVTTGDGLSNSYTTTYAYANGLWHEWEHEFLGFGTVEVRDPDANATTTEFYQDLDKKGRPFRVTVADAVGNVFAKTENTWYWTSPYVGVPSVKFVYLDQVDNFTYEGDTDFKQAHHSFAYDAFGNLTKTIDWGEVGNEDIRQTFHDYVYNEAAWILNRPVRTQLFKGMGASRMTVGTSWFYYDGVEPASIGNPTLQTTPPTKGLLTLEVAYLDTNDPIDPNPPTRLTYDAFGNVKTVTDALMHTTTNDYDGTNHIFLEKITNALGHSRSLTYDPKTGQVLTSTDQNNVTTTTVYDALGRVENVIGPTDTAALPTVRYVYDPCLLTGTCTAPIKATTCARVQSGQAKELCTDTYADGLGRTIQVRSPAEDPAKQVVTGIVEFDTRGQVKKQWLPYLSAVSSSYVALNLEPGALNLAFVSYTYDPVGRLLATTNPDSSITTLAYDDWTVSATDALGHQTRRTSDAFGRLATVEEFNEGAIYTTSYQYDARDALTQVTDHAGNVTTIIYDTLGRKTSMVDPDMGAWTYTYDAVDNLKTQTDARGVVTTFDYDALNRLTQKSYALPPGSQVSGLTSPVSYTYDNPGNPSQAFPKGRLTEGADGIGSSRFIYDTLGRLTTEQRTLDGTTYTIQRAYDLLGRLTSLTYPDNAVATYTYNDQGGIETISLQSTVGGPQSIVQNVEYNAAGQILKLAYGNGLITDYTYNPQTLRLDQLVTRNPQLVTLQDFTYTFDAIGNVLGIADAVHTASQSFGYDDLNRLKTAAGSYGSFSYAYNPIGNMTLKQGVTMTYGQGGAGPHAVTTTKGWTLTYDANGNLTTRAHQAFGTVTYTYDAENRLVHVGSQAAPPSPTPAVGPVIIGPPLPRPLPTLPTPTTFVYDGDGGRVKQIVTDGPTTKTTTYLGESYELASDGTKTKYLFVGSQRIAALETPPGGLAALPSPPPRHRFVTLWHGLREFLGVPVAEAAVLPGLRFYHGDHLGSTNLVTDGTGAVVEQTEYTPYGSVSVHTGSVKVTQKFTGQTLDAATGLYYYHARYYDPTLGRFTQADTIVPSPGDPQTLNRYAYARNNPLAFVDPTGNSFWSKFFGAIVGIFVTIATGGCIPCGIAAFSFTDTFISSLQAGASFGTSLSLASVNAAISGAAAVAAPGIGAPAAFAGAGAAQGVADAAIVGADVGHAAWVGAVAGLTTYAAGPIIGGGVASSLNGGSFGAGAAEGAYGVAAVLAIAYTAQAVAQGQYDAQGSGAVAKDDPNVAKYLEKHGFTQKDDGTFSGQFDKGKVIPIGKEFGAQANKTSTVTVTPRPGEIYDVAATAKMTLIYQGKATIAALSKAQFAYVGDNKIQILSVDIPKGLISTYNFFQQDPNKQIAFPTKPFPLED